MFKKIQACVKSFLFLLVLLIQGCNSSSVPQDLSYYQLWVESLSSSQYTVAQGNAYLMQNTDCPEYVEVFDSCFGQNPASPYIIPQPPIGDTYVDPFYAEQFNTSGPDGLTNIFYRLSENDALITILAYPPEAAYMGYQSYVFTRESSFYDGITPPRPRVVSPDPSRYDIFGSLGDDINNIIIENQYGRAPWGGNVIMYITSSNQNLTAALITNATNQGINPNSIFVEPVGSNVITGIDSTSDDMLTLMRYAVPENDTASTSWENALSSNMLVYRVSNAEITVSRFGENSYTAHTINTDESSLQTALQQLSSLLQEYLEDNQPLTISASSIQTQATTEDDSSGVPTSGLVGAFCIAYGTNCEGDNQDTSTYATLLEYVNLLGPEETAFIAGVNHSLESVNNSRYISLGIYNATNSSGVASASQTNAEAAGFESGFLNDSAQGVLTALGISIPPGNDELTANIDKLYVTFVTRNCNNSTVGAASSYCIDLEGSSLISLSDPISITERSYIIPGSTTGGYVPQMVYPFIIAGTHNFIAN